eukprot:265331_1
MSIPNLESVESKQNEMEIDDQPNRTLSLPSLNVSMEIEDNKPNEVNSIEIQNNIHQSFVVNFELPSRPNQTDVQLFAVPPQQSLEIKKGNRFYPIRLITHDNHDVQSQSIHDQYNGFSERKTDQLVDWNKIQNEETKYAHQQAQRNIIDKSIPDMNLPLWIAWSRYDRKSGKTVKRKVLIHIIKKNDTISGTHLDYVLDNKVHSINKTFICEQKQEFIIQILMRFFNIPRHLCGKTRELTHNIFKRKMAFPATDAELNDVVMTELDKVCKTLLCSFVTINNYPALPSAGITLLLYETILDNKCLSSKGSHFFQTFE